MCILIHLFFGNRVERTYLRGRHFGSLPALRIKWSIFLQGTLPITKNEPTDQCRYG